MTVKELAQRYSEKPTESRYDALRDAILREELPKIWAEIDGAVITGMIHKLTVFAIFNEHIRGKEVNTEHQSARALDISSVEVACKNWVGGKEKGE